MKTIIITLILLLAFATNAHARSLDAISVQERAARLASLAYTPFDLNDDLRQVDYDFGCLRTIEWINVVDPKTHQTRIQQIVVTRPTDLADQEVPVVLIVPTIEGDSILERTIAPKLCHAGMGSIISDVMDLSLPQQYPAWGLEDGAMHWAIISLRTIIDYAQRLQYFDGNRVGILGLSLGGIVTAAMAGVEPDRLKAIVTVVGGGNMPNILATSDQTKVMALRNNRMQAMRTTDANAYENALRQTEKIDPIYFSAGARRDNIFMIMANSDTKVPTPDQQEMWHAFGQPKGLIYSGGHIDTILEVIGLGFSPITDFFHAKFGMQ